MKMSLDLSRFGPQVEVYARIRENMSRVLHINLRNGPFSMIPDGDEIVILRARTPDERHLFLPCEVCGDHVECTLNANILAREGAVRCEVAIYSNEYQLLYSPEFRLNVLGAAAYDDDVVEASDDFSALTSAINAANELANMRFSVETLPAGSEAAVEEREGDEVRHLHFSLPRGETGERGEKGEKGERGEKGESGHGIFVKGTYPTLAALEGAVGSAAQGDMYNVGAQAPYELYMWDMTSVPASWICLGQLQGEKGAAGEPGNMHRNLLDNHYFAGAQISGGRQTGGFPINQRGNASYAQGFGLDRWFSYGIGVEVGNGYVTLRNMDGANNTIRQSIEHCTAATVQNLYFSYLNSAGECYGVKVIPDIYINVGNLEVRVDKSIGYYNMYLHVLGTQEDIVAVKLELGDKQTLARQENGVWVLNDPPPDYAQELVKCQRYFQLYSAADKRPAASVDCRPTMAQGMTMTQDTITIGSATYYYNSTEL